MAQTQTKTAMNPIAQATIQSKRQLIEQEAQAALQAAQDAQAQLDELAREEEEEQFAYLQQLRQKREGHLADAAGFRELAKSETDETEKEKLNRLAMDELRRADELADLLGIQPEAQASPKLPFLKRPIAGFLQVAGVLGLIAWAYSLFNSYHDQIVKLNQALPPEAQLQPYDKTSIQKFIFEKMVVFADLPVALIIVALIVPPVAFYVLPFIRSKRDFYTEFYEDLTAWQRILITTVTFLGVLFFLAFSHSVKP